MNIENHGKEKSILNLVISLLDKNKVKEAEALLYCQPVLVNEKFLRGRVRYVTSIFLISLYSK